MRIVQFGALNRKLSGYMPFSDSFIFNITDNDFCLHIFTFKKQENHMKI